MSGGLGDAYIFSPLTSVTRGQMAAFLWRSAFPATTRTVLSTLRVTPEESRDGYDRDKIFGSWLDVDKDGCNTRCEVLEREKRFDLSSLPTGGWYSVFDGATTGRSSSFDIDHVVPLAEAWDSGGSSWSLSRWKSFGNDLDDVRALRAVSASSNRSKGDRDPAEWMPPLASFRCQYVAEWVALKSRWSLSVDSTEKTFLDNVASSCGNPGVLVKAAAPTG